MSTIASSSVPKRPDSAATQGLNSLGFAKSPAQTRVVVAMSGGVDSSVVAAMLTEQGYDVIGITLQLYDHGAAIEVKGACCAGADIHDARTVAHKLGIPHYVLDYESRFRDQVMDDFADSYLSGHTPIPCVRCNQTVKFTDLLITARQLGADCLATGHYVSREMQDGHLVLKRGRDTGKDQSYFLFATTAEQLDYLRFPLGNMQKEQTRKQADSYGLVVSDKPDSQDICFVPNGRYADVVRKLRPGAVEAGEIVHIDGTVLGHHNGVIDYTIGQRRGLGIGGRNTGKQAGDEDNAPLYVVDIDASRHHVLVGPKEALACEQVELAEMNWLTPSLLTAANAQDVPVMVKLRNTAPAVPARIIHAGDDGRLGLKLDQPEYGIASGQAGVLYDAGQPELVLGGGWIVSAPTLGARTAENSVIGA